jgi:hypothetical protein
MGGGFQQENMLQRDRTSIFTKDDWPMAWRSDWNL